MSLSRPSRRALRRRRIAAALALLALLVAVTAVLRLFSGSASAIPLLVPRGEPTETDPLAYAGSQDEELERAAAFGLSHPLFAKSAGGVFACQDEHAGQRVHMTGLRTGARMSDFVS